MPTLQQLLFLGTDRVPGAATAPHPSLESAWSSLNWSSERESALLDATALAGAAALAGFVCPPSLASSTAAVAPAETEAEAPPAATTLLGPLLDGEFRPLLIEWLETAARNRQRIPAFFLPRLLDAAHVDERSALAQVVGARGRWLAVQNSAWSWLLPTSEASSTSTYLWETGSDAERLAVLRATRASDPAAGRALLEKSWPQDPPAFREAGLGELARGLSLSDAPFLETCLRERRRETRQQAQVLLGRLPDSPFALRMRERAKQILVFKTSFLSKKLEVILPARFEASWKSDGIEEKPPAGVGEKAFWAQQILEWVEPRHWVVAFDLSVPRLVSLVLASEWSELILRVWFRTLRFAPDAEMAEALFQPVISHFSSGVPAGISLAQAVSVLLAPCNQDTRWKLAEKSSGNAPLLWAFLPHLHEPAHSAQASAVLRALAPMLRDGLVPGGSPQAVLAARCLPTSLRAEAGRLLEREQGLTKTAEAFLRALELRAQLQASFSTPA